MKNKKKARKRIRPEKSSRKHPLRGHGRKIKIKRVKRTVAPTQRIRIKRGPEKPKGSGKQSLRDYRRKIRIKKHTTAKKIGQKIGKRIGKRLKKIVRRKAVRLPRPGTPPKLKKKKSIPVPGKRQWFIVAASSQSKVTRFYVSAYAESQVESLFLDWVEDQEDFGLFSLAELGIVVAAFRPPKYTDAPLGTVTKRITLWQ